MKLTSFASRHTRSVFTNEKRVRRFFLGSKWIINQTTQHYRRRHEELVRLCRQTVTWAKSTGSRLFLCFNVFCSCDWNWIHFIVIMLGAESRLESRLAKLESLIRNPQSALNLATLLVSLHSPRGANTGMVVTYLWVLTLSGLKIVWKATHVKARVKNNNNNNNKMKIQPKA